MIARQVAPGRWHIVTRTEGELISRVVDASSAAEAERKVAA
jgi:hypothetical protein